MNVCRTYIQKRKTGAIWSSVDPKSGVWKKESLGLKFTKTQQVGSIAINFFPFTNPKWNRGGKCAFIVL